MFLKEQVFCRDKTFALSRRERLKECSLGQSEVSYIILRQFCGKREAMEEFFEQGSDVCAQEDNPGVCRACAKGDRNLRDM